jgi:putative sterol carrier protein
MIPFPSAQWAHAFRDVLNARKSYREVARGLTADFIFHVQKEGPLKMDHMVYVKLKEGEAVEVEEIQGWQDRTPEFVIAAKYSQWVALMKGELEPVQGLLTRKIQVSGSVSKLMRHVAAAKELIRATRDMDTKFA